MARHIVGLFPDAPSAQRAAAELSAAGFDQREIQVVSRDQSGSGGGGAPARGDSAGGLVRFGMWLNAEFTRLGLGPEEAKRHHEHVVGGGVLVCVQAQGREDEARHVLQRAGASNMDQRTEAAGTAGAAPGTWQLKPEVGGRPSTVLDDAPGTQTATGYDTPDDVVRMRSDEAQQEDEEDPLVRPEASARGRDIVEHPDQLNLH
jgi:hypothetical protein